MEFDQETPLKEDSGDEASDLTLKIILLRYLELAHNMGLKDKTSAYCAGLAIGTGGENCQLEQVQYDAIKFLVDKNEVKDNTGKQVEVFNIVINQQVKKLVDEAEEVKDEKTPEEE